MTIKINQRMKSMSGSNLETNRWFLILLVPKRYVGSSFHIYYTLTVCLVGEPRERSGAAPLPRPFGWGAAGAERLLREYTLYMRVGSVP
jgi:hypothetical protein